MKYRENKRTGDKISEIGMGTAYIVEAEHKDAVKTVRYAYENGINYFDLAAGDGSAFALFGEALSDVRDQVMYQIHFGADYSKGTYGWTLNLDAIKKSVDKPGILTVLPGAQSVEEVAHLLKYYEQSEEDLDYSIIGSFAPPEANGKCVYCNHCKPCPAGLDIGMINKFYDLAKIGDDMAKEHYLALDKKASDCISCGHCNSRCPFGVDQMSRMQEIKEFFGA